MSAMRLVIITPRYWPLVGETERWVAHLVQAIRTRVEQVTVLTARWDTTWPREVVYQETRVVRLPHAPRSGWHWYRYARSVGRWLREHASEMDLAYTANLRHDATAAVGALKKRQVAVVVRAEAGDDRWLETVRRRGRLKRLISMADAMIAPTRSLEAELLTTGCGRFQVRHIPVGVPRLDSRTAATRFEARAALAKANHDLRIAEYAPLAVAIGRLGKGRNLNRLVDAWGSIAARWPAARLWFLGDGPLREPLYERIRDAGWHHQVFLPGTFDELAEVFMAADVFVAPEPTHEGATIQIEAMSAGIPVIAADTPDNRDIMEHGVHGLLVAPGNRTALSAALETLLESPDIAAQYGAAARTRVEQRHSISQIAEEHFQLFERLVARKGTGGLG
ncbi:MAG: glycosyltransferase family 4 protein [Pirellulaceae bacterium]